MDMSWVVSFLPTVMCLLIEKRSSRSAFSAMRQMGTEPESRRLKLI
jgi:hypothetical protein